AIAFFNSLGALSTGTTYSAITVSGNLMLIIELRIRGDPLMATSSRFWLSITTLRWSAQPAEMQHRSNRTKGKMRFPRERLRNGASRRETTHSAWAGLLLEVSLSFMLKSA